MSARMHRVLYLLGRESVELRTEAVPRPQKDELLIRVDAATTCGTDLKVYLRGEHPRMLKTPCPFGHELAGTVVTVGREVARWREGDAVVVANSAACSVCRACRTGRENLCEDLQYLNGAFADHVLVPDRFVRRSTYPRPKGVEPALACLAEPLACVLHGVEAVEREMPAEVLVLGGGPIGLMFVAELAHRGSRAVLADPSPDRLAIGRRMGATATIEISAGPEDAPRLQADFTSGPELVFEVTGSARGWAAAVESTAPGGTVVLFGGCPPGTRLDLDTHVLHYSELTVRGVYHHRPATFEAAIDRIASGELGLDALIGAEHGLEGVETALRAMRDRRILKAAIRPSS